MVKFAQVIFALLLVCGVAFAEQLKFQGTFDLQSSQLLLTCTLARPNSTSNYTLAGTIKSEDGQYTLSGTGYYKTGKIRGFARRGTGTSKFEQPVNGTIGAGAQSVTMVCAIMDPKAKVLKGVQFRCDRQDTKDPNELIPVYVRTKTYASPGNKHMAIDFDKGTGTIGASVGNEAEKPYPIRFSPVPKAVAFGTVWEFWLDASAVPKEASRGFKMSATYIDKSAPSPYIDFEMGRGSERIFRKSITWNIKDGFDMQGIYFQNSSAEFVTVYFKLQQMKRGEYERLVGVVNSGSGTNSITPKPPANTTSKPPTTTTTTPKPPTHPSQLSAGTVKGDVGVRLPGKVDYEPLKPGMVLPPKTMIDVDPDSSATFTLPNGATLTLRGGTQMMVEELTPSGGQARVMVRLMFGEILYRHTRNAAANVVKGDFMIRTNTAVTSSRGTEFSLKFDPDSGMLVLNLTDGQVEFDPGHGLEKMVLDAPTTVTLSAKGG
ncbi:MAG: FecR domain-containing protein [Chthonomonas sp.]|nr:FecR domain-containing protein [Chthonomonas sp.]